MKYEIKITPEVSYMDEDVRVEISGEAGAKINLCISSDDYYSINGDIRVMEVGTIWESTVAVTLDNNGHTVLNADIFTTLQIKEAKKSSLEQKLANLSQNRDCHMKLQIIQDGDVKAEIIHRRIFCDDTIQSEDIISDKLLARYFTAKDVKKRPAIIVVSGSDGRIEKAQAIAQCLARRGYSALAVCYFGMEHVPADLNEIPMEYIEYAIRWLEGQPSVDKKQIGIYGRSKGGEMVLQAAVLFPKLKFVVANTPSCYVQEGLIGGSRTSKHSSWCYQGKEITFVPATMRSLMKLLGGIVRKDNFAFRRFYEYATWKQGRAKKPQARIEVEKSNASFLFLSSNTDGIWPSDLYAKEACSILKQNGKQKNCQEFCYEGAGHMLTLPYQPIPNCEEYGGSLEKGIKATIPAWEETIKFIQKNTILP